MAKLFIYYSHTGNGKLVADKLEKQGYEIREIKPKRDIPKSFFLGVFFGGMYASFGAKFKLKEFDANLDAYDEVVIGSPVWAAKLSCPINTLLKKINLDGKKVSFILYSGSGEAEGAVATINSLYKDCKITILKEPKKYSEELEKI